MRSPLTAAAITGSLYVMVTTPTPDLTLYESPGCWKCVDVREVLDEIGLEFTAVTVKGNPEARALLVQAMGEPPYIPMLTDGAKAIWDRRRIMRHLQETYGEVPDDAQPLPEWMGGSCLLDEDCD